MPPLFSEDVPNIIARNRINCKRCQFIWSSGFAAVGFTNEFYCLVLQFEQVLGCAAAHIVNFVCKRKVAIATR